MGLFHIKKGKHRSGIHFRPYLGLRKRFSKIVRFELNCDHMIEGPDVLDANKLFGVSFGKHHKNSIRVGWRATEQGIQLCMYDYNDGKRTVVWLDQKLELNKYYRIVLSFSKDRYNVMFTDMTGSFLSRNYVKYKFPKCRIGYYLYPYFGGNTPAPKNMFINLV